ncbi:hypothetical protein ACLOJK_009652 [Asimina triloba]
MTKPLSLRRGALSYPSSLDVSRTRFRRTDVWDGLSHEGTEDMWLELGLTQNHRASGSGLVPWPARLTAPPPRLADFGYSGYMFVKDLEIWQKRVETYWKLLGAKLKPDTVRNLMDMRANMGSFAAALRDKNVWVMNVVPIDEQKTLKIIYDRGLIGTVHDCRNDSFYKKLEFLTSHEKCEAFSTYPRTYDLLHAWTIFSDIENKGCSGEDLLLEMDRMLRPKGFVIIRDKQRAVEFVKKYLTALHWEQVVMVDAEESVGEEDEKVLIIQKKIWFPSGYTDSV